MALLRPGNLVPQVRTVLWSVLTRRLLLHDYHAMIVIRASLFLAILNTDHAVFSLYHGHTLSISLSLYRTISHTHTLSLTLSVSPTLTLPHSLTRCLQNGWELWQFFCLLSISSEVQYNIEHTYVTLLTITSTIVFLPSFDCLSLSFITILNILWVYSSLHYKLKQNQYYNQY